MSIRIMLRISGREDVVLDLRPGHFLPVSLRDGRHGPVGHFSVLLIHDGTDNVTPAGIHVPTQQAGQIEQPGLDLGDAA